MWSHCLLLVVCGATIQGLLYPSESETRQIKSLDGIWQFRIDDYDVGESERWYGCSMREISTFTIQHHDGYFDFKRLIMKRMYG